VAALATRFWDEGGLDPESDGAALRRAAGVFCRNLYGVARRTESGHPAGNRVVRCHHRPARAIRNIDHPRARCTRTVYRPNLDSSPCPGVTCADSFAPRCSQCSSLLAKAVTGQGMGAQSPSSFTSRGSSIVRLLATTPYRYLSLTPSDDTASTPRAPGAERARSIPAPFRNAGASATTFAAGMASWVAARST